MTKALWKVIFVFYLFCASLVAHADEVDRIQDILHRNTFSQNGQVLLSEVRANVEECVIRLNLDVQNGCEMGGSYFSRIESIDVRALVTRRDSVDFEDFTGTQFESLKGAVRYHYRPFYHRVLRFAYGKARQILDEEYEKFPVDVDSRLRALSTRYGDEIDPRSYAMSFQSTQYCSGVETKSPLPDNTFTFYVEPSEMDEFAALIESLSQTCDANLSG